MPTREPIVEGCSKILYEHSQPGTGLLHFQDPAASEEHSGKGRGTINAGLSGLLMQRLNLLGLSTHFIKMHNSREHLVKLVETLPIFVSVHNAVSYPLAQSLGIAEGTTLGRNIVECRLKDRTLGDPLVTQDYALSFGWCGASEWDEMIATASRVNDFLLGQFSALHLELLSFRMEFGRYYGCSSDDYHLLVCDEISLDTCYVRDLKTGWMHRPASQPLEVDTDQFYQEIARRFGIVSEVSMAQPLAKGTPHLKIVG